MPSFHQRDWRSMGNPVGVKKMVVYAFAPSAFRPSGPATGSNVMRALTLIPFAPDSAADATDRVPRMRSEPPVLTCRLSSTPSKVHAGRPEPCQVVRPPPANAVAGAGGAGGSGTR